PTPITQPPAAGQPFPSPALARDDLDLFLRQPIQLVHQRVYLAVGGLERSASSRQVWRWYNCLSAGMAAAASFWCSGRQTDHT
ncbi:MAG: hypothetical protein IMY75_04430, partial [Chloroflexi bacterium]|nr:hypothetical protein [Chloroflexota bacterium]